MAQAATVCQLEKPDEWHERRSKGIGGSDAAPACGLSPWKTRYQLWLEKTGQLSRSPIDQAAATWGTRLEAVIADEFADRTGWKLRNIHDHFVSKAYPWQLAEIDRHIVDLKDGRGPGILECKTANAFTSKAWGDDGEDDGIPDHYMLQVQHQLAVTGWKWAYLAVLIGGRDYRQYPIERDENLIAEMTEAEEVFWQMVQAGIAPDPDFDHPSTTRLMRRVYPGTNGQTITLPEESQHWHMVLEAAQGQVKRYKGVVDGAKNHLLHLIGDNAVGVIPIGSGDAYQRKEVRKKPYAVDPEPYIDFRHTTIKEKKS